MKAAVAGRPIAHSRSPDLHRAAYAALGLDWTYERRDCGVPELATLFDEVRAAPGLWAGLSLTMPLKEAAVALLDVADTTLGAVNTVLPLPSGGLRGLNTDTDGLLAGLEELAQLGGFAWPPAELAVLGAGGTARAAVAAAARAGSTMVVICARDPDKARPLAELGEELGIAVRVGGFEPPARNVPVVVTVPSGAADDLAASGPVLDVRYDPWPTPYAARAQAAGFAVVGGLSVLVGQAAVQVSVMTGRPAPLEAMRRAVGLG